MTYLEIKDDLLKAIELARAVKREPSKRFDEVLKSGDFSSTKSQIAFSDYITSLSNDCGIAIASIMLIGRDGIIGYHGTKDEILTETMEELRSSDKRPAAKILIDSSDAVTYLKRGKARLDSM